LYIGSVQLPDFEITYRLSSPSTRPARTTEIELRSAFPAAHAVRFLGSGSFGDTWLVDYDAVKIIVADTYDTERITREVMATSVANPHIVAIRGTASLFAAGEDRPALLFEFVDGEDLASVVSTRGRLDAVEVRDLAIGLLDGIAAMRAAGVIHRDIKPENVQLRKGDPSKPVILDLGLVHIADSTSLTIYPAAIGTRPYMPPEVLRGEHAVHRSDVYAVGITLHIAATSTHPFLAEGEVVRRSELVARIEKGIDLKLPDRDLAGVITAALRPQAFRRPTADRALGVLR
jgi:eukaryotic-like serine/threonine-protein kinase